MVHLCPTFLVRLYTPDSLLGESGRQPAPWVFPRALWPLTSLGLSASLGSCHSGLRFGKGLCVPCRKDFPNKKKRPCAVRMVGCLASHRHGHVHNFAQVAVPEGASSSSVPSGWWFLTLSRHGHICDLVEIVSGEPHCFSHWLDGWRTALWHTCHICQSIWQLVNVRNLHCFLYCEDAKYLSLQHDCHIAPRSECLVCPGTRSLGQDTSSEKPPPSSVPSGRLALGAATQLSHLPFGSRYCV